MNLLVRPTPQTLANCEFHPNINKILYQAKKPIEETHMHACMHAAANVTCMHQRTPITQHQIFMTLWYGFVYSLVETTFI